MYEWRFLLEYNLAFWISLFKDNSSMMCHKSKSKEQEAHVESQCFTETKRRKPDINYLLLVLLYYCCIPLLYSFVVYCIGKNNTYIFTAWWFTNTSNFTSKHKSNTAGKKTSWCVTSWLWFMAFHVCPHMGWITIWNMGTRNTQWRTIFR